MSENADYQLPEEKEVKLPRNIRHWAKSRGLVIVEDHFPGGFYMRSKKKEFIKGTNESQRYFRILGHINYFQICDGSFDRWANSVGYTLPIPMTRKEFDKALDELVTKADVHPFSEDIVNADCERRVRWANEHLQFFEERWGWLLAWANKHGRHGRFVRAIVRRHKAEIVKRNSIIRSETRHRDYKLAELAALKLQQEGAL